MFPRLVEFQRIMFPLKIKKVDHCDWKAILELPTSLETGERTEAHQATRFLWDVKIYEEAARKPFEEIVIDPISLRKTSLTAEEEHQLSHNFCVLNGPPRGSTYGFKVPELLKGVCRPVWACHINDWITTEGYTLATQEEVWRTLHSAVRVIQFDGRSMYDQFALEESIRPLFSFRLRCGDLATLRNMPMGFAPACRAAQLVARHLAHFPTEGCTPGFDLWIIIHIDNFAFVISRAKDSPTGAQNAAALEQFTTDVITRFFERCLRTGFQLNEATTEERCYRPNGAPRSLCYWE